MSDETRSADEIRDDIEATREDLGETVEALAAKTDVKARAQGKAEEVKDNLRAQRDAATAKVKSALPGGGGDGTSSSSSTGSEDGPGAAQKAQEIGNQAVATAKANPLPLAVAGALLLGYLIGRRLGS